MIILVTGGRSFADYWRLGAKLNEVVGDTKPEDVRLRHGRCNPQRQNGRWVRWDAALTWPPGMQLGLLGADWYAHLYALKRGWVIEERPAAWGAHGNVAGPIRNQAMVDEQPRPDVCVAAPGPGSSGTFDCARRAASAGIRVEWVTR